MKNSIGDEIELDSYYNDVTNICKMNSHHFYDIYY